MSETAAPSKPRRGRVIFSATLTFVVLAGVAFALMRTAPQPQAILAELPPLTVEAHTVVRRDLTPLTVYTGRLQPKRSTSLRFEVVGQLRERAVEPGMVVAEGDTLLLLDDRDFKDQARTANAELALEESRIESDRVQLEQTRRQRDLQVEEVQRYRQLGERSLLSQSALNAAEQKLATIETQVAQLQHAVATAEQRLELKRTRADRAARDLERTRLTAPFEGRINTVEVEVGDRITGEQTVVTLVDVAALDFYVEVDGQTAAALQLQQTVEVEINEQIHTGSLIALQTDPDSRTFTHAVRIRIPGSAAFPGQLATARFKLPTLKNVLAVPIEAIRVDPGGQSIYRIEGQRLERLEVTLGPRVDQWQVIEAALEAGELIVARDVAAMSVRRTVQIRNPS